MRRSFKCFSIVAALILLASVKVYADTVTIVNNDSGWYDNFGDHVVGNTNYASGDGTPPFHLRNYFVFNLSGLSGTVNSVQLQLYTYGVYASGTYNLFDVSANPATLQTTSNSLATYNDLGSGISYGTIGLTTANSESFITINLNAAAVAAIQSSQGGLFVIGGDFISSSHAFGTSRFNLGNQLIINSTPAAVPEPTTMLMLVTGLTGLGLKVRRNKLRDRRAD